jgi:tRNA-binding protein
MIKYMNDPNSPLTWSEFERVDLRIGTILSAKEFPKARNPAYQIVIDFGELGTRKTSAQVTSLYRADELIGRQVVAVVNFPPKQIANFMSECLILGGLGDDKDVILLKPDRKVVNGTKVS